MRRVYFRTRISDRGSHERPDSRRTAEFAVSDYLKNRYPFPPISRQLQAGACNGNILVGKTDINKTTKQTAAEIWEKDNKKKLCAEINGYKILYIWESEYNESIEAVIKKCMRCLTS